MKKRLLAIILAVTLLLGLHIPAMAYDVPDFTDVPAEHWAYGPIMEMAEKGVMKGVGAGRFDPDGKLTAEMFIVLIGRVLYPDLTADGSDWSGPYIAKSKEEGLWEGTAITDETVKSEISRYDMATVLHHGAKSKQNLDGEKDLSHTGAEEALRDFQSIPKEYVDRVRFVYGAGLMKGDQNGDFNGQHSVMRMEAATVLQRFLALSAQEDIPQKSDEPEETPQGAESTWRPEGIYLSIIWDGLKGTTPTELSPDELAKKLDLSAGLDQQEFELLMEKCGFTAANLDAAYRAAKLMAEQTTGKDWRGARNRAAVLGNAAARAAKAEGIPTFTFTARGELLGNEIVGVHRFDDDDIKLGFFDKEGKLLAQPKLTGRGEWKMDITISVQDWDQDDEFTLKLLEPCVITNTGVGNYRYLPEESRPVTGTLWDFMAGSAYLGLRGEKAR